MSASSCLKYVGVALLAGAVFCAPAFAEKPENPGNAKHQKSAKGGQGSGHSSSDRDSGGVTINAYFGDRERSIVRDYYSSEFRSGHCPPGLAKKNNGCMPPGQAKKWRVGHPLPGDVVYYDLPSAVVVRLGTPPSGHRYVRVAADILLIAVGTGMVVDAIEDLSSM